MGWNRPNLTTQELMNKQLMTSTHSAADLRWISLANVASWDGGPSKTSHLVSFFPIESWLSIASRGARGLGTPAENGNLRFEVLAKKIINHETHPGSRKPIERRGAVRNATGQVRGPWTRGPRGGWFGARGSWLVPVGRWPERSLRAGGRERSRRRGAQGDERNGIGEVGRDAPNEANFDETMSSVETHDPAQVTANPGSFSGLDNSA